ncbi:xanthine dehydrogenase molybdopterin binding subunit [Roseibacillus persicicus]|uniref:Xanthine dehydrogenase n=1 Tax=Roseibacillus persicicus TaxID=454148 RepID=A0A918TJ75_9BACT|nr:xanthine dehydrogenase molybdopterin binding subunit [Roseibacillus persicicus]GHC50185.1 hypothetical protein GCM10007100_15340 [Roseibacillus persicicus]
MSNHITINGQPCDVSGAPLHQTVLDLLRESGKTGTKCGCNEGDCGACTLLLLETNDQPPRAINGCLALVKSLIGREILTVEGLANDTLHPAQEAMIDCNGSQCGYCTPGIVCSLAEASARGLTGGENRAELADQLSGNLCRCTGYRPIREAALACASHPLPAAQGDGKAIGSDDYHFPNSISEALELKSQYPEAVYIAGATELAVLMNKRGYRPPQLIALENVAELREIRSTDTAWFIGGGVVLTDVQEALAGEFPALDDMLRLFASRQIRHRATLAGNLVTASPIGDSPPVLLALDAIVHLAGPHGERTVPLADFFLDYRKTVLADDELLVRVEIPRNPAGEMTFQKVSKRREMDISTVAAAIRIAFDENGVITRARLAFGGVAATPARALQTEQLLLGLTRQEAGSPSVLASLAAEFTPMSDLRGSAYYRSALIVDLYLKHLAGEVEPAVRDFGDATFSGPEGQPSSHESAQGHVTGAARYVEDDALRAGSALRAWPVRSTEARARILELDCSAAEAAPGVRHVLTSQDIPGLNNTGPVRHDEPLLAEDEVFYHGQLIAVVVGESLEACRLAAEKVSIRYQPLDAVIGLPAAIANESFHTEPHFLVRGEIEQGLSNSKHRLQGTLEIGGQEHFYLESHAASARPDGEGGIFVRSSTQHPSEIQTILAEVLGTPRHRIVVESPRMGGGFGGKETQGNAWAAVCALAALKADREVVIQLDRDHDMEWSGKRHPFFAKYEVGFDDEGTLLAAKVELVSDGGWALDLSVPVCDRALFHLDNSYYIPHVSFSGRVARTHTTSHTAFRGFGGPQGMVVIEEILGQIAQELGIPPEQVREHNFYHGSGESSTTHYGEEIVGNRLPLIWPQLLESSRFSERRQELQEWNAQHPFRKRGLAITPVKFGISFTLKHYNQAGALVLIYADGSVQVNHGGTEMGQGLHTKILSVAMRELGLPADRIRLMHTRTDKVPNTSATAASSGSDLNGMAVADACRQLKERLTPLAAQLLDCDEEEVSYENGRAKSPGAEITFQELVAKAYTERIQLSAAGFYKTPDLEWDWEVGKGKPFHYYAFGAAVSEVEIDGFTGMIQVRRVDILHDVGDSLNADIDRGQIEGAFVQGQGWLTSEELKWADDGRLLTHSASTYAIPAFSDAPQEFNVTLLKDATQENTIHGSKAVGEPPFMLAISVREALRDGLQAFGQTPASDRFPSPLTAETLKGLIGPMKI